MQGTKQHRTLFVLIALVAAAIFAAAPVRAQSPGGDNCLSEKCHPGMGKAKYVHGPVGAGVCTACHRTRTSYTPEKHSSASFTIAGRVFATMTTPLVSRSSRCAGAASPPRSATAAAPLRSS